MLTDAPKVGQASDECRGAGFERRRQVGRPPPHGGRSPLLSHCSTGRLHCMEFDEVATAGGDSASWPAARRRPAGRCLPMQNRSAANPSPRHCAVLLLVFFQVNVGQCSLTPRARRLRGWVHGWKGSSSDGVPRGGCVGAEWGGQGSWRGRGFRELQNAGVSRLARPPYECVHHEQPIWAGVWGSTKRTITGYGRARGIWSAPYPFMVQNARAES